MSIHIASLKANLQVANGEVGTDYMPLLTQWNDGERGTVGGSLSCWGANITDAHIADKDGKIHPAIRSPNMDEKLGLISSDKVHCISPTGQSWTVKDILKQYSTSVRHHGYKAVDMKLQSLPDHVVVRTQMATIPLAFGETEEKVCVSNYSYQTLSEYDPKNALVVCTPSGTFFSTDKRGQNKLMAHKVNEETGVITEHWHTVSSSGIEVGKASMAGEKRDHDGDQKMNKEEMPSVGIDGMQGRNDSFCVISIPLKQNQLGRPSLSSSFSSFSPPDPSFDMDGLDDFNEEGVVYRSLSCVKPNEDEAFMANVGMDEEVHSRMAKVGISIERDETKPITITFLLYTVVKASQIGVPSTISKDICLSAIEDMERIYGLCYKTCRLSELPEMLHELTQKDVNDINEKITCDLRFV